MVYFCAVPNCPNSKKNNNSNVTYHRFPLLRPYVLKFWLRAIPREDFQPSPHHVLCSEHFLPECFLPAISTSRPRRQLKKSAIPTLFNHAESEMVPEEFGTESDESLSKAEEAEMKEEDDTLESVKARLHQHCRICAGVSEELVPVFGHEGYGLQLLEKIHTYLPIMVTEEDLLPVSVCISCVCKLEQCHEFVSLCVEADSKLKQILGFEADDEDVGVNEDSELDFSHVKNEQVVSENSEIQQDGDIENAHVPPVSDEMEMTDMKLVKKDENVNIAQHSDGESASMQEVKLGLTESAAELESEADQTSEHLPHDQDANNGQYREFLSFPKCVPIKKVKKKKEKPKFKVVILKMKNAMNMTNTPEFKKALDHAMRSKKPSQASSRKEQEGDFQPLPVKTDLESPGTELNHLENEPTQDDSPAPRRENGRLSEESYFEEITEDHTYTYRKLPSFSCKYCSKAFPTSDHLLSHEASAHQDKVFGCTDCKIVFHSSRLLEAHLKRHSNSFKFSNVTGVEDKLLMKPIVYLEKLEPFLLADPPEFYVSDENAEGKDENRIYYDENVQWKGESASNVSIENMEWEEENGKHDTYTEENKNDVSSFAEISEHLEGDKPMEPNIEDDIKVVDVHVEPEGSSEDGELDSNSKDSFGRSHTSAHK